MALMNTRFPQKRTIKITLDVECYDDHPMNLDNIDWKKVLELEGNESVSYRVKDLDDIY